MPRKQLGDRYKLDRTIGSGSFGKVKLGISLRDGSKVAIKIMSKQKITDSNMVAFVRNEVQALQRLDKHKHVVNLIEILQSQKTLYLVLELVQGGELFDRIKTDKSWDEPRARYYYKQLISALEFMHSNNICHRDLKLENLLLSEPENPNDAPILKVTDFGLSGLRRSKDEVFRTTLGSPNYVAPEVINGKGYDGFKADIWSSGVILYSLVAGFLPFDEENTQLLFQKISTADLRYPQKFSSYVVDLLNHIIEVDPVKRFNLTQIKEHVWMQNNDNEIDHDPLSISPHVSNNDPNDPKSSKEQPSLQNIENNNNNIQNNLPQGSPGIQSIQSIQSLPSGTPHNTMHVSHSSGGLQGLTQHQTMGIITIGDTPRSSRGPSAASQVFANDAANESNDPNDGNEVEWERELTNHTHQTQSSGDYDFDDNGSAKPSPTMASAASMAANSANSSNNDNINNINNLNSLHYKKRKDTGASLASATSSVGTTQQQGAQGAQHKPKQSSINIQIEPFPIKNNELGLEPTNMPSGHKKSVSAGSVPGGAAMQQTPTDSGSEIMSDFESPQSTPSMSPRYNPTPISMTAFDLIGIVSTQMLNNVFTRSLQEERSVKTYTRFVTKATPVKILFCIQEAVRRMADCQCRFEDDRYELNVTKQIQSATIKVNIQIYQTPANEHWVECRRASGNIFKYHEFFDEFREQYNEVMKRMDKNQLQMAMNPNNSSNNNNNNNKNQLNGMKRQQPKQIQFRSKNNTNLTRNQSNNSTSSNHVRSASEPQQKLDSDGKKVMKNDQQVATHPTHHAQLSVSGTSNTSNSKSMQSMSYGTGGTGNIANNIASIGNITNVNETDTPTISPSPSPIMPSADNQIVFDFDAKSNNSANTNAANTANTSKDSPNAANSANTNSNNNSNNSNKNRNPRSISNVSNESNDSGVSSENYNNGNDFSDNSNDDSANVNYELSNDNNENDSQMNQINENNNNNNNNNSKELINNNSNDDDPAMTGVTGVTGVTAGAGPEDGNTSITSLNDTLGALGNNAAKQNVGKQNLNRHRRSSSGKKHLMSVSKDGFLGVPKVVRDNEQS